MLGVLLCALVQMIPPQLNPLKVQLQRPVLAHLRPALRSCLPFLMLLLRRPRNHLRLRMFLLACWPMIIGKKPPPGGFVIIKILGVTCTRLLLTRKVDLKRVLSNLIE